MASVRAKQRRDGVEVVFDPAGRIREMWYLDAYGERSAPVPDGVFDRMVTTSNPDTGAVESRLQGTNDAGAPVWVDVSLERIVRYL